MHRRVVLFHAVIGHEHECGVVERACPFYCGDHFTDARVGIADGCRRDLGMRTPFVHGAVREGEVHPHEPRERITHIAVAAAQDAHCLLHAHVVHDRGPRVILRRSHEPLGGMREPDGIVRDRWDFTAAEEVEGGVARIYVARLVAGRGERVGPRAVHRSVNRFASWGEVLHRLMPGGTRVGDDLLALRAVPPRVVEDAVMAGMTAGDD